MTLPMDTTYTWANAEQTCIKAVDKDGPSYIPVDEENTTYAELVRLKTAIAAFVPPSETTKTRGKK